MLIPNKVILSKLILSLEMHPKTILISLKFCKCSMLAFEKNGLICKLQVWHSGKLLPTRKPSNRLLPSSLNIILLNTSVAMVRRKWARGSPCLILMVALTHPLAQLFSKTSKVLEDKQPLIQNLHLVLYPFSIAWFKKP